MATLSPPPSARSRRSIESTSTSALMTCPPSKPISMRIRSLAMRDELREDAVNRVGMDERHLQTVQAAARPLIDQFGALAGQPAELCRKVVDLVGHVMHPR